MTVSTCGTDLRLRLLPVALFAIVVTTAVPVDPGPMSAMDLRYSLSDVLQNVVLYLLLGAALRQQSMFRIVAWSALLSATIEVSQLWSGSRYASPVDVVSNVAGTVLGALLASRAGMRETIRASLPINAWSAFGAGCFVIAWMLLWTSPAPPSGLAGWSTDMPLLVGNEKTGDRPWRGQISGLAILDGINEASRTLYSHPGPLGSTGGAATQLPDGAAREFAAAAIRSSTFAVRMTVLPDSLSQGGPARLLSFSESPWSRNMDLGQEGRSLVFRVRTPVSGPNGTEHMLVTRPILRSGRAVDVVASYDGRTARVTVDGRRAGHLHMAAAAQPISSLHYEQAPAVWGTFGAALTILAIFAAVPRRRALFIGCGVAAGATGLLLMSVVGLFVAAPPDVAAWPRWLIVVGAVGAALCSYRASDSARASTGNPRALPSDRA